ncbi:MAG: hypothetical protein U0166_03725 [Acidobacteriota bacterium]
MEYDGWPGGRDLRRLPRWDPGLHAMAFDARQRIVLFGGYAASFNVASDTWSTTVPRTPASRRRSGLVARAQHAMAWDASQGKTILFGGWDGSAALGDTCSTTERASQRARLLRGWAMLSLRLRASPHHPLRVRLRHHLPERHPGAVGWGVDRGTGAARGSPGA